jgi:hypothetical protein
VVQVAGRTPHSILPPIPPAYDVCRSHAHSLPSLLNQILPRQTSFSFICFLLLYYHGMAQSSESASSRRRVGRRRLPPLAPGPSLQFVVASHPDDFRAGPTMRNVRSHVMYNRREQSSSLLSESGNNSEGSSMSTMMARTPSPMTTQSDGILEDDNSFATSLSPWSGAMSNEDFYNYASDSYSANPMWALAARIISATTSIPARSTPPTFEEASESPFFANAVPGQEPWTNLMHEYINRTPFYCHGTVENKI